MSYTFNGSSAYLKGTWTWPGSVKSFTIFGWAKLTDVTPASNNTAACFTTPGGSASVYGAAQFQGTTGNVSNLISSGGTQTSDAANNLANESTWGAWAVFYTINASDQITEIGSWIWDGSTETYSTPTTGLTNACPSRDELILGARTSGTGDAMTAYLSGKLAHCALYTGVLSAANLTALTTRIPLLVNPYQMLAYWPLTANANAHPLTGSWHLTATNATLSDPADDPVLLVPKLKLLAHASAASATNIEGIVFDEPPGTQITGARIGEFTGAAFEAALEGNLAVLKVPISTFDTTGELIAGDIPVAIVRNASNTTGAISCLVIED